jgi:hypothetical protein
MIMPGRSQQSGRVDDDDDDDDDSPRLELAFRGIRSASSHIPVMVSSA